MVKPKERVERPEKYRDGEKDDREGGGKERRIPAFYQQTRKWHRDTGPRGKRPLEYRKHALAFGCDIPGGWEQDNW